MAVGAVYRMETLYSSTISHQRSQVGVSGEPSVQDPGRPVGERSVDDVLVAGDPADVSRAPVDVVGLEVEDHLVGERGAEEVAGGRVEDALRLGRRPRRVEEVEHVFRFHRDGRAVRALAIDQLVPPVVPARHHVDTFAEAIDDEDVLDRRRPGHRLVIEGVKQSHWLASYESWGSWLNASYENPASGDTLTIQQTYTPRRESMFRRWLLSMPESMSKDADAPTKDSGWDDSNSVVLVGEGSLGDAADSSPDQVTRAYLNPIQNATGKTGRSAWWIGPENHKAKINMAKQPRDLSVASWESAQGDTAEVGVGALSGLGALDSDAGLGDKLITNQSLRPAGIDRDIMRKHFYDLTASSRGVLASVRTGHLKKDLSLLFEKGKSDLPVPYRFDPGDVREPSIRPMSPEIANKAVLKERHFASWTRMRHFYRMYRRDSDAKAPGYSYGTRGTNGTSRRSRWSDSKPWTDCNFSTMSLGLGRSGFLSPVPYCHSYYLYPQTENDPRKQIPKRNLRYLASPVYVLWNPYNVELRVPDKTFMTRDGLSEVQPLEAMIYRPDGTPSKPKSIGVSQRPIQIT